MKNFVVHQLLYHAVITHPEQVIVSDGKQFTFREFYSRVVKLANSLSNHGVKKGTVIGVLDVNTHRFLEMHFACSMLGAILHTINFRLAPEQMVYSMVHAGDEWVFVSDVFAPAVKSLFSKFPNWVLMSDNRQQSLPEAQSAFHYEDLLEQGEEKEPANAALVSENDVFSIFYTTGTTGKPKGIQYKHQPSFMAPFSFFTISHFINTEQESAAGMSICR